MAHAGAAGGVRDLCGARVLLAAAGASGAPAAVAVAVGAPLGRARRCAGRRAGRTRAAPAAAARAPRLARTHATLLLGQPPGAAACTLSNVLVVLCASVRY